MFTCPDVLSHLCAQLAALVFLGMFGANWLIRSHFRRVQVIEAINRCLREAWSLRLRRALRITASAICPGGWGAWPRTRGLDKMAPRCLHGQGGCWEELEALARLGKGSWEGLYGKTPQ